MGGDPGKLLELALDQSVEFESEELEYPDCPSFRIIVARAVIRGLGWEESPCWS
jgi:hypothetical protein